MLQLDLYFVKHFYVEVIEYLQCCTAHEGIVLCLGFLGEWGWEGGGRTWKR